MLHLRCGEPFGDLQCRAEGDVQGQGVLDMRRRLWQGREQRNPGGQVADGFQMGRAVAGVLTRPLPVEHCLLGEARLGVVIRQQFRLGLGGLGKLRLQHLGNVLMVPLASAPQQRLIRRILDQGMLEEVCRLRR